MSTFANVYVGGAPNDLTGDPLRNAFQKINTNFANIASGNVVIGSTAGVTAIVPPGLPPSSGRTGNVYLTVSDVYGAASTATLIARTDAANTYANALYATTTSTITANVYAQVSADLATDIADLATDLINSGSALVPVYANINATNANVTAANAKINSMNANLGSATNGIISLQNRATNLETNVTALQSSVTGLVSNASQQSSEITTINANVTAANISVVNQGIILNQATANINALYTTSNSHTTSINSLTVANTATQSTLANLTANAATQATQIRTIDANLGGVRGNIISLQANALIQAINLNGLQANAMSQEDEIRYLDANLGVATVNVTGLLSNVAALQANLAPVQALQANDAVQGNQIRILDANLGVATTNISLNETQINSLRANITAANSAIVTANTNMKSYVDARDASITSAWTANAVVQAVSIANLNAGVTAANLNITTLFANAGNQQANIDYLISNVTASAIQGSIYRFYANANAAQQSSSILFIQNSQSAFQTYANANLLTQTTNTEALNANLGAYQTYANVTYAPVANLAAIVGNLNPVTSNLYSIGTSSKLWNEIHSNGNVQTNSFVLAARSIQTPLVESGNINANTGLIYSQLLVGNISTVDTFGTANVGNLITYTGVYYADGTPYFSNNRITDYLGHFDASFIPGLPSTYDIGAANLTIANLYVDSIRSSRLTLSSVLQFANLTTAQITAIASPQPGMSVYNYSTGNIQVYNGSKWANVTLT